YDEEEVLIDFRIIKRDGSLCWISHGCRPIFSQQDGRFLGRRASNRDITIRKELEEKLQYQAQCDYLTGIANRRYFMERAQEELARSLRKKTPLAILMFDLDYFKAINDTHGHHVGDLVLQRVAIVCKEALRNIDVFGRIGGEEFAVVLPETNKTGAIIVAKRLHHVINHSRIIIKQGNLIQFTASFGISILTDHQGTNLGSLLQQADKMLYQAKENGRNQIMCI
ncbi:hypothetical protein TI03_03515, partial [Achromatium sp. WMS1]